MNGNVSASSSHHMIELLAPLYSTVPRRENEVTVYAVKLRRTANDWLQIVFPELSRPGKLLAMDVACVNQHTGSCRCDFVRLLRSVLTLSEKHVLRVTTKYVISNVETGEEELRKIATLQLFLALHERVTKAAVENLSEFELVTSHLQSGLRSVQSKKRDANRLADAVQTATQSKCHVVGCELHPLDGVETQCGSHFSLDEVFQRLTSQVEVEQMPMRDDETYVARMKRAKRQLLLTDLPIPALHAFIRMLGARELAAVGAVCSTFQHLAYEIVPGLKLSLYSHQRRGLRWLLYREGSTREELKEMPHPFVFPAISVASGICPHGKDDHVIDLINGKFVNKSTISRACDFRGGLLCDEPGTGKTITMLALILRTKGQRSDLRHLGASSVFSESRTSISLRSSGHGGRVLNPSTLVSSTASLIVVPNALIDHWKFQIQSHVPDGVLKVFVDDFEFKRTIPSPHELATYDVVITSFERLTREWKHGKPMSALEANRPARYGYEDGLQRFTDGSISHGTSPLLMVHWVRLIVDEGHNLGAMNLKDHMEMATRFHADKRWIMTGTPTPSTQKSDDWKHIHGLLVFLRDRPFGELDKKAWNKMIAEPFGRNKRAGFVALQNLLNRIMLRHTKASVLTQLPTPIRLTVLVGPTTTEYATYNGIVGVVRSNLVTTKWDPDTPGMQHPDSLLNPLFRYPAMEVLTNLRLASCGGCKVRAKIDDKSFEETITMLNKYGVHPERISEISQFMKKAANVDCLSLCTLCCRHLQLLMLIPCGHMACADCVELHVEKSGFSCGICHVSYNWEDLQRLQPGARVRQYDEEWEIEYNPHGLHRLYRPTITTLTTSTTMHASKAFYVATRIKELRTEFARAQVSSTHRPKVVKAIIFSQFPQHLVRTHIALNQQGIQCAEFLDARNSSPAVRNQNLLRFRRDPTCSVLLLTDVGSHGLDLSFVTHIFLMDEIWDKSLEKQVISRAHRMGAQQSVVVEQLLMDGSVEEQLHEMIHKKQQRDGTSENEDSQGSLPMSNEQLRHLLENLRLMDEAKVTELGCVKFKVLNDQGDLLRDGYVRLSDLDEPHRSDRDCLPPSSAPVRSQSKTGSMSSSHRATPASQPNAGPSRRPSAGSSNCNALSLAPTTPSIAASAVNTGNGKQKMGSIVRVDVQSQAPVRREQVRPDFIDLTSDGDSADDQQPSSALTPNKPLNAQHQYLSRRIDARQETATPPASTSGKRKLKRCRIVFDDDESDGD